MIKVGAWQNCKAALMLRWLSTGDDHVRPHAAAPAIVSLDLRCATPVLPIAIGRTDSSPPRSLPKTSVQRTSAIHLRRQNPHSV
jgi:hypothetical protein